MVSPVPDLLLAAGGQNEHRVQLSDVSIQRNAAARAASDDQFPEIGAHGAPDQRVAFEDVDGANDVVDARRRGRRLVPRQMVEYAIQVVRDFRSKLDAGHA